MEIRSPFYDTQPGFNFRNSFRYDIKLDLPFLPAIDLLEGTYGLCGGMCFATLDYHFADLPLPSSPGIPLDGSRLWRYLWKRQLDSFSLIVVPLRIFQWMGWKDGKIARKTMEEEIPYLVDKMKNDQPVVLALLRDQTKATDNHQVLVTRYAEDDRTIELTVYDPNHPNLHPAPTIRIEKPTPPDGQGYRIEQSTGELLRGFFIIDYRFSHPPTDGVD